MDGEWGASIASKSETSSSENERGGSERRLSNGMGDITGEDGASEVRNIAFNGIGSIAVRLEIIIHIY